jgi:hypothetical protein
MARGNRRTVALCRKSQREAKAGIRERRYTLSDDRGIVKCPEEIERVAVGSGDEAAPRGRHAKVTQGVC